MVKKDLKSNRRRRRHQRVPEEGRQRRPGAEERPDAMPPRDLDRVDVQPVGRPSAAAKDDVMAAIPATHREVLLRLQPVLEGNVHLVGQEVPVEVEAHRRRRQDPLSARLCHFQLQLLDFLLAAARVVQVQLRLKSFGRTFSNNFSHKSESVRLARFLWRCSLTCSQSNGLA